MPRWSAKTIAPPDYYVRLKDVRIALGLYLKQMAALADMPEVTYLCSECSDTTEIKPLALARFALKLDTSVDYLLGLTDVPKPYALKPGLDSYDETDTTRIRELRLDREITGKAMAENLDISAGAYSTKELHPEVLAFTIIDIIRIAKIFNTSTDYLLKLTDDFIPHAMGSYKKVPLGVGEIRRMKCRLGLVGHPVFNTDEIKEYCLSHFLIRSIRLDRGLQQAEVAKAIGLKTLTYSVYERNPHRIPSYYLIKLADFYGVTLDYLVGRDSTQNI